MASTGRRHALRAALLLQVLLVGVAYAFIPAQGPVASTRRGVCARAGAVVRMMADGGEGEVRGIAFGWIGLCVV